MDKPLYYINENGLMVFTEEYHLQRGYWCSQKCKHCPFWPKYQKGNTNIKNEKQENRHTG
jgi:hypothetical protein